MARFSDDLIDLQPRTGRIITEDGEAWNQADSGRFTERYSLLHQTVTNGAVEITKRTTILEADSADPFYYYLSIPEGRRFYLWQRQLSLTEGRYMVDLVRFPSGVTGGEVGYKSTLAQAGSATVGTDLLAGVTPNVPGEGVVVSEQALVDSGAGIGSSIAQSASTSEGVLKTFISTPEPVLIRITRTTVGEYISSITLIAWEEDI